MTSLPEEAAAHADTIFLGPGEDTWPRFLADFRAGRPKPLYRSSVRTLAGLPPIRRDLIKRHLYLVPELDRGLARLPPHLRLLLQGGLLRGRQGLLHATRRRRARRDRAAARPPPLLPRRPPVRRRALRDGALRRHAWDGAPVAGGGNGAVGPEARACSRRPWRRACAACSSASRRSTRWACARRARSRTSTATTAQAVRRLHDLGVMVNGSFVFGMDEDDASVFDRTVDWAIGAGHRDRHLPHPDAVPGNGALPAHAGRGTDPPPRLGPLRHAPRRVPHARHARRGARGRLLARLSRLLPLGIDLPRRCHQARVARRACATSPMPRAGRSSSRSGTSSSARGGWRRCCRCWRPCSAPQAATPSPRRKARSRPNGARRRPLREPLPKVFARGAYTLRPSARSR